MKFIYRVSEESPNFSNTDYFEISILKLKTIFFNSEIVEINSGKILRKINTDTGKLNYYWAEEA
jgi:hypothetical protein